MKKGLEPSKIFEVKSLVEYQEDSIVSKEIIKKEVGTITVFAFDKGQGLSPHSAPFDAVIQVIDGTAEITIGQQEFELTSGAGIVMPANIDHAVKAVEKFKMVLTMIKG